MALTNDPANNTGDPQGGKTEQSVASPEQLSIKRDRRTYRQI